MVTQVSPGSDFVGAASLRVIRGPETTVSCPSLRKVGTQPSAGQGLRDHLITFLLTHFTGVEMEALPGGLCCPAMNSPGLLHVLSLPPPRPKVKGDSNQRVKDVNIFSPSSVTDKISTSGSSREGPVLGSSTSPGSQAVALGSRSRHRDCDGGCGSWTTDPRVSEMPGPISENVPRSQVTWSPAPRLTEVVSYPLSRGGDVVCSKSPSSRWQSRAEIQVCLLQSPRSDPPPSGLNLCSVEAWPRLRHCDRGQVASLPELSPSSPGCDHTQRPTGEESEQPRDRAGLVHRAPRCSE